ncbi:MAG: DUF1538 domain-containing protein [Spirochaetaceae bacterium]|jgi:hypothetical protein|nr:DUF1538 domain-containing protein [Spirochaetaceae bacterium]
MNKILFEKIMEAFSSVLPITIIVLISSVVFVPMPSGTILMFLLGAAMLVVGMGFFTLGADMAMMPMGEGIGVQLTKTQNLLLVILISFFMGVVITIAEPDLQVLAQQVPSIPSFTLILTVGIGVGAFLIIAVLRIMFKIPLSILLIGGYILTFILACFTPPNFIPVAFDSGGVTTGPITVPFILAMGLGVVLIRGDKGSQDDSFGLVALCSIGPIMAVMALGMIFNPSGADVEAHTIPEAATSRDVIRSFLTEIPHYAKDVVIALAALVFFFVVFQLISNRYKKHQLKRIAVGFLYTLIGLLVFLTGVNVGFIPVGLLLGTEMAASPQLRWLLIPLGMIIGYFIVMAEPAVHVLKKQVEDISSGSIPQNSLARTLAIGMAAALVLTMTRILLGIPLMYILIPGYVIALVLTFFVPRIFVGIAFDSGGVCSGPMTSTFLLPLAMGVCAGAGGDMMKDAFGVVALVALTPLVVIQLMGLASKIKMKKTAAGAGPMDAKAAGKIIVYPEVDY